MTLIALVVAAGRGTRVGGDIPKQYQKIGGESVLRRTLRRLTAHPAVDGVLAVIHPDDSGQFADAARGLPKMLAPVAGGATRQASVKAGLDTLRSDPPRAVLVHDAARPFASDALIARAAAAAVAEVAAVPALPVTDTVKQVDAAGRVGATLDRSSLRAIQTPQAFCYNSLSAAHAAAAAAGIDTLTDDAAVMEWAGHPVTTFAGEADNVKITTADDLQKADSALRADAFASRPDVRTGTGFDVHAFGAGDHVMLGGVAIPHGFGLAGHSDAEVGLHALTDALLGALCDGDIGAHFPPSDPQWKGAASHLFLAYAADKVRARDGLIAHLDLTLICEAPKVGPHRDAIRARVAEIAGVPLGRVSVKATTTESLGFTGRREGIAALASATIRLPLADDIASDPASAR